MSEEIELKSRIRAVIAQLDEIEQRLAQFVEERERLSAIVCRLGILRDRVALQVERVDLFESEIDKLLLRYLEEAP